MKGIYEHIVEKYIQSEAQILLEEINNEVGCDILLEKLQDSTLSDIAKKFKSKEIIQTYGYYDKDRDYDQLKFNKVFGNKFPYIAWDKITDSDWQKYDTIKEIEKYIRKIYTDSLKALNALAAIKDKNGKILFFFNDSVVFIFNDISYYDDKFNKVDTGKRNLNIYLKNSNMKRRSLTQSELISYIKSYNDGDIAIYVLELNKFSTKNKVSKRNDAKQGMIKQGDEDYYRELARKNKNRYEKIIAKMKAQKTTENSVIIRLVKSTINRIMSVSELIYSDPKYIDLFLPISYIIEELNGYNGLPAMLAQYIKNIAYSINGTFGTGHQYEEAKNIEQKIKDEISKFSQRLDEIENKM